jgi:hypothetical protein
VSATMTEQEAPEAVSWRGLKLSACAETLHEAVLAEIIVLQDRAKFLRVRFADDESRPASHRTYADIEASVEEQHAAQLRRLLINFAPATIAGVTV